MRRRKKSRFGGFCLGTKENKPVEFPLKRVSWQAETAYFANEAEAVCSPCDARSQRTDSFLHLFYFVFTYG